MTSKDANKTHPHPDLALTGLRIERGSVSATVQLAEQIKALILSQQLPAGARLPAERELMAVSGLSRIPVRAAVGMLERQGWVVQAGPRDPCNRAAGPGSVLRGTHDHRGAARPGVTPRIDVLGFAVEPARPSVARVLGLRESLTIRRRYNDGRQPVALVTIYLPAEPRPSRCASASPPLRPLHHMGAPAGRADQGGPASNSRGRRRGRGGRGPWRSTKARPSWFWNESAAPVTAAALEVVVFHYRPERYGFTVVRPRTISGAPAGIAEERPQM